MCKQEASKGKRPPWGVKGTQWPLSGPMKRATVHAEGRRASGALAHGRSQRRRTMTRRIPNSGWPLGVPRHKWNQKMEKRFVVRLHKYEPTLQHEKLEPNRFHAKL